MSARLPLALLTLCCAQAARADNGDWFPPPCNNPGIPAGGPQLVLVRTSATDSGRDIVVRREADGALWVEFEEVARWTEGHPGTGGRNVDGRRWLSLAEVPGLLTRLDACRQELL